MGFYERQVLPRLIDVALGKGADPARARVTSGLRGEVLEVGFGSGRNVPHLPDGVTRLVAVDPATVGRSMAASRIEARGIPVEFVGLDGQSLPLDDASVDHVLVTWTLCTIPDVGAALHEMHRVLRPGGGLHFVEHGRSPDPDLARKQASTTRWWRKVAGGCRLDRQIDTLIADAGFVPHALRTYQEPGPAVFSHMFEGIAVKPA